MLEHAAALALEMGVSGFTIDELARRSGVAKTTIYRHFPTKNELLIAAFDGQIPSPEIPDTGSFREDLIQFLGVVLPYFTNPSFRMLSLDLLAVTARDPELGELLQVMAEGRSEPLKTMIERGQRRGEVTTDLDYLTMLDLIEGPLFMRSVMWPDQLEDYDLAAHVDRVITVVKP